MIWPKQPFSVQILALYLLFAAIVVLVRFVRLALVLRPISKPDDVSIKNICDGQVSSEMLTESALAGRLPKLSEDDRNPQFAARVLSEPSVRHTLRLAKHQLNYRYGNWHGKVTSSKGLVPLTLVLAFLVFILNLSDVFRGAWALTSPAESGAELFRKNLVLAFQPLALALFFCTIVYVISTLQERALRQRMTEWRYFRARLGEWLNLG